MTDKAGLRMAQEIDKARKQPHKARIGEYTCDIQTDTAGKWGAVCFHSDAYGGNPRFDFSLSFHYDTMPDAVMALRRVVQRQMAKIRREFGDFDNGRKGYPPRGIIPRCQSCHTCGNPLRVVLDGEEWCDKCQTYRRYVTHGFGAGAEDTPCLPEVQWENQKDVDCPDDYEGNAAHGLTGPRR